MLSKISKVPWIGATFVLVLLAGLLNDVGGAGESNTVYGGCRTVGGNIIKVWTDSEEPRLCKPWQTLVSWNPEGPMGPAGPKGDTGAQ